MGAMGNIVTETSPQLESWAPHSVVGMNFMLVNQKCLKLNHTFVNIF